MRVKRLTAFCLSLISILFVSCGKHENRIFLDDSVYWAMTDATSTVFQAEALEFQKLEDFKAKNLERVVGKDGQYAWLKIDFELPESLKYKSLGFVVPYLHFADISYLNNEYIGSYGRFPPQEYSAQYCSHFYTLPYENLNQTGINTIMIKVWCYGNATISDGIFIDEFEDARIESKIIDFLHSEIYMLFEGGLLIAFILFMMLGAKNERKNKAYFIFGGINFVTIIFLSYFFGAETPWYQQMHISNRFLTKAFLCLPLYIILFHIPSFLIYYLELKERRSVFITRIVLLLSACIITGAARDYTQLRHISSYMLILVFGQVVIAVGFLIQGYRTPASKQKTMNALIGFSPLVLSVLIDFLIRNILLNTDACFFAIYGWICTIIIFIFFLTREYKHNAQQILYLSRHLQEEVRLKTATLTTTNDKLEREIANSTRDMEMAAIVQHKFYPQEENFFDGWEVSVCFDPMSKISGDLYDYFAEGTKLDGIGLFDASGHGVAASLVCMLAKSIIFRAFVQGKAAGETMAVILERINEHLIEDKGEVQNYLTGVLMRVNKFDSDGKCLLEMASAGHPYPIFYSSETDEMITVTHDEYQEQYGALGIKGMEVSFPNVDLTISVGDVLVLYTDGVSEAQNIDGEDFGAEGISRIVYENRNKTARQIQTAIKAGLKEFTEGVGRTDDISFMVLKRVPRWEK